MALASATRRSPRTAAGEVRSGLSRFTAQRAGASGSPPPRPAARGAGSSRSRFTGPRPMSSQTSWGSSSSVYMPVAGFQVRPRALAVAPGRAGRGGSPRRSRSSCRRYRLVGGGAAEGCQRSASSRCRRRRPVHSWNRARAAASASRTSSSSKASQKQSRCSSSARAGGAPGGAKPAPRAQTLQPHCCARCASGLPSGSQKAQRTSRPYTLASRCWARSDSDHSACSPAAQSRAPAGSRKRT
mmetsp:Transcript_24846/g.71523  ORF Transcript_24846/g.71523 Transcript_24846/m.71523 type:complete len:242 (+) Transcript_24846:419-1144(+)